MRLFFRETLFIHIPAIMIWGLSLLAACSQPGMEKGCGNIIEEKEDMISEMNSTALYKSSLDEEVPDGQETAIFGMG